MNTSPAKSHTIGNLALIALLLLLPLRIFAQSSQIESKPLTTTPVEYRIGGNDPHRYVVSLKQNEFLQVHVAQNHADVTLRLLDKNNIELARMNFLNRDDVIETLSFVAPRSDSYTLEVTMFDAKAAGKPEGGYRIHREAARKATLQDRRRVEVEKIFVEAMAERATEGHLSAAIAKFREALVGWQELGDAYMADLTTWKMKHTQAVELAIKARAVLRSGKSQEYPAARTDFENAANLFREVRDPFLEYVSIMGAAAISQNLGDNQSAIDLVERALPFFRILPSISVQEASVLDNLARLYILTGDKSAAISRFVLALPLFAARNDETAAAAIENDIGALYYQLGLNDDALLYLNRALKRRENLPDKCALRATLTNMGAVHARRGEKPTALALLTRSFGEGTEDLVCPKERPYVLINTGKIYNEVGAPELALTALCAAAKLPETIANPGLAAATHNNLGNAYYALGKYDNALTSYQTSATLLRLLGDRQNEATVLSNIGVVHSVEGRNEPALDQFAKALEIRRQLKDASGEATTLNNIGEVLVAKGEIPAARTNFNRALALYRATEDRNGEAVALANEMLLWDSLGNRSMAIFYGKQAINRFQELRGAVRGLDNEIQKNYLSTVKRSYQVLAGLLIAEGRFEQAVQVLNLYQDETFFDFDVDPKSRVQQADFSSRERDFAARYEAAAASLGQIGSHISELRRKLSLSPPNQRRDDEMQKLQEQLQAATEIFSTVLAGGEKEFAKPGDNSGSNSAKAVAEFREMLAQLGEQKQKAVALYTLSDSNKLTVLLVKPNGVEAYSKAIGTPGLKQKVDELFKVVTTRRSQRRELLTACAELYDIVFKSTANRDKTRTLAADLASYKPDTLLWSLEGDLRPVPMAVLYDTATRQYLVEKYQNVVFTRTGKERFLQKSMEWTGGIAFGKSNAPKTSCRPDPPRTKPDTACELIEQTQDQNDEPLGALTHVDKDLPSIAGILRGPMLLNDAFTLASFVGNVQGKNRPLVHISSHFCFRPGDATNSFLLLGNDDKLSLSTMKNYRNLFDGVDLLVLAACKTALQSDRQGPREIDSLAELSQRLHARSVIATLWDADATNAGKLMIEIYKLHQQKPGLSKAALLRQAQLRFIRSEVNAPQNIDHPYYWAPFVLYGNFL